MKKLNIVYLTLGTTFLAIAITLTIMYSTNSSINEEESKTVTVFNNTAVMSPESLQNNFVDSTDNSTNVSGGTPGQSLVGEQIDWGSPFPIPQDINPTRFTTTNYNGIGWRIAYNQGEVATVLGHGRPKSIKSDGTIELVTGVSQPNPSVSLNSFFKGKPIEVRTQAAVDNANIIKESGILHSTGDSLIDKENAFVYYIEYNGEKFYTAAISPKSIGLGVGDSSCIGRLVRAKLKNSEGEYFVNLVVVDAKAGQHTSTGQGYGQYSEATNQTCTIELYLNTDPTYTYFNNKGEFVYGVRASSGTDAVGTPIKPGSTVLEFYDSGLDIRDILKEG